MRITGLLRKALQLRAQQRCLKLAQPVVEANRAMVKLIGHAGAAGIDVSLHALLVFQVIGQQRTWGGNDMFRMLSLFLNKNCWP
jgi:hypothetical protein